MTHRIGFIGTGVPGEGSDTGGFAMAYRHATGYRRLSSCDMVACADIVPENADAFAGTFGIPSDAVYEDHQQMLAESDLDIVSVCTPPDTHAPLVIDCASSDSVDAVHCEKPMADTWGDCRAMARACADAGVQLTINHQMRFGAPYRRTKDLVDAGQLGDLRRIEFGDSTLFDMGTHLFDLANWFVGDATAEWVLAGLDYTEDNRMFGVHNENQALAQWRYDDGTYGLASTGRGDDFLDCYLRVIGDDGEIQIGAADATLRYRQDGSGWHTLDTDDDGIYRPSPSNARKAAASLADRLSGRVHDRIAVPSYTARAIESVVTTLSEGEPSELGASSALAADELVFAAWESVRRRRRVDLPLNISDNPLRAMVESGDVLVRQSPSASRSVQ